MLPCPEQGGLLGGERSETRTSRTQRPTRIAGFGFHLVSGSSQQIKLFRAHFFPSCSKGEIGFEYKDSGRDKRSERESVLITGQPCHEMQGQHSPPLPNKILGSEKNVSDSG